MAWGKTLKQGRAAFAEASSAGPPKKKLPWKIIIPVVGIVAILGGYYFISSMFVRPKGNGLYGICRVYIERHLQFPTTLRIVQFEQSIPEGENKRKPTKIDYEITFSSLDGFGQSMLNTVTCGFRNKDKAKGDVGEGVVLERILFDGREDHGWSDTYYPPDKKNPRAADDRSEDLELFNQTIPAIDAYPPDLTLPWHNLRYMEIKDLQNL